MTSVEDIYAWFRAFDTETFAAVACQGNEPTEEDVAAFEEEAGFRLPADFRAFTMSPLGGLFLEVQPALWPRPEEYAIGPAWTFLRGLMVFGIANTIPPWLDLRVQLQRVRDWGVEGLVPFFQRESDPDRYCFDEFGRVFLVTRDAPEEPEPAGLTFPELVLQEIEELAERKDEWLRVQAAGKAPWGQPAGKKPAAKKPAAKKPASKGKPSRR